MENQNSLIRDDIDIYIPELDLKTVIEALSNGLTQQESIKSELDDSGIASFHVETENYLGSIIITKKREDQDEDED